MPFSILPAPTTHPTATSSLLVLNWSQWVLLESELQHLSTQNEPIHLILTPVWRQATLPFFWGQILIAAQRDAPDLD